MDDQVDAGRAQLMISRSEHAAGITTNGNMTAKAFARSIGVAHGTVKRWLHDGMPARPLSRKTWITPDVARPRLTARFGEAVVYFAQREDGAVKIGWSSDVARRVMELRRDSGTDVKLLACYPGTKPDESALHSRFAEYRLDGEWFRRGAGIDALLNSLGGTGS